ncbi:MAG: response regulator transcription factor [Gammaproteobacteria bacterium]|nr:response regulator transcription factor [Gammaproteobacteria bacterium]
MRLLLIEDDIRLAPELKKSLKRVGYAVDWIENGIDGELQASIEPYDVIVLDLGLPGRPGLDVLKNWRLAGLSTPVIILTARDSWHERVDGLKAGADDYLGKPFHTEELLARLDALIRRNQTTETSELISGDLKLDESKQCVTLADGKVETLTAMEYRLLRYLLYHPDRVLSKSHLTEHVYEEDNDRDSNVIEVYINRLRQKIGKSRIETRRGQGYIYISHPSA